MFEFQVKCFGIVDKYIEFDSVIICLDAVLHKPQTYRHLLFNIDNSVSMHAEIFRSVLTGYVYKGA